MYRSIGRFLASNRRFLVFLGLLLVFRGSIADWNPVPTGSMKPTIQEGDVLLVNKLAYDVKLPFSHICLFEYADPERGDIVIFDSASAEKKLVKRVIGLPGDQVSMINNILMVNGVPATYSPAAEEPGAFMLREQLAGLDHLMQIHPEAANPLQNFAPAEVPTGHYLVLGDNRDRSADSRVYGFVPRQEIVGRASHTIASFDMAGYFLPRTERFFHRL